MQTPEGHENGRSKLKLDKVAHTGDMGLPVGNAASCSLPVPLNDEDGGGREVVDMGTGTVPWKTVLGVLGLWTLSVNGGG